MKHISKFRALLFALLSLVVVGCESERPIYEGRNFIMFSAESHTLGVIDNEEWFEIPVSASRTADVDRHTGGRTETCSLSFTGTCRECLNHI